MKMPAKRQQPVKETQMVSLADIAFLIIFFFLLSSQFMKDKVQVNLPQLPKGAKTETPISVSMDAGGKMFVDGDEVADKLALESRLRDLLSGKTSAVECEVRFKCDREMKYKEYRPVYEAISNAGGVISIIHEVK